MASPYLLLERRQIMNSPLMQITSIISLFIQFCTVCSVLYGFSKFLSKPTDTLKERVSTLEKEFGNVMNRLSRVDERLENGNLRFKAQEESNRVTQTAILALIDKEIKDSIVDQKEVPEELSSARKELYDYLTDR